MWYNDSYVVHISDVGITLFLSGRLSHGRRQAQRHLGKAGKLSDAAVAMASQKPSALLHLHPSPPWKTSRFPVSSKVWCFKE